MRTLTTPGAKTTSFSRRERTAIIGLLTQLKSFLEGCIDAERVRGVRNAPTEPDAPEIRRARRDVNQIAQIVERFET